MSDNVDKSSDIVGKTFSEVDKAVQYVEEFCKQRYHPVKHTSRTTIRQYNTKIKADDKRITDVRDDAVYSMLWGCKPFGSFKYQHQLLTRPAPDHEVNISEAASSLCIWHVPHQEYYVGSLTRHETRCVSQLIK